MDPDRSFPPVIDPAIARGWLDAVEVHLGAVALGRTAPPPPSGAAGLAGIAAVAAKFLAVGTPRTMGLIGLRELAPAILAAQRAYAAPRELRVFDGSPVVAARTAEAVGGRVVGLAAACACDIVVARGPVALERGWIRGGTLVTALDADVILDPELVRAAVGYTVGAVPAWPSAATLGAVAAGLLDGRTLEEICLVVVGPQG